MSSTDDTVEIVAKALMLSKYPNDKWDERKPDDVARLDHMRMARAAIEALRSREHGV